MTIDEAFNLAVEKRKSGQVAEAEALYRQILALQPGHAPATLNLGALLCNTARFAEAETVYRMGLMPAESNADIWANLGNAMIGLGRFDEAFSACRSALAINPQLYYAYDNLGTACSRKGDFQSARVHYQKAIELRPDFALAHCNLGIVLHTEGDLPGAAASFKKAIEVRPDSADAHNNLGSVLSAMGDRQQAIAEFRTALLLRPDMGAAQHNLALALYHDHQLADAEAACRRAIELHPDWADAHLTLSMILSLGGDLTRAWPEYEWRFKAREHRLPPERFVQPRWTGEELHGRTILLHAEQGLGDAIQFVRFAPMVAARGGKVLLYCHQILARLLRTAPGVDWVMPWDQHVSGFEVHCPLLSLPGVFGTSLTDIPAAIPYLSAGAEPKAAWQARLKSVTGLKVGLAWAGSATHTADQQRSISPAAFVPLGRLPKVRLISLQKDRPPAPELPLIDWTSELTDLADTAALIDSLDLVVTVDTVVAHLAGALGKPVWLLLQFTPDWRWMLDRMDSPWYPTMRLFRQPRPGDWQTPIEQLIEAIKVFG